MFRRILEDFELLPVTVDSHFGEYISWAHDVADHKGIIDFLELYKDILANGKHTIELTLKERVVPIIDGIATGGNSEGLVFSSIKVPKNLFGSTIDGGTGAIVIPLPSPDVTDVPEPATMSLLALAGVALLRRRK